MDELKESRDTLVDVWKTHSDMLLGIIKGGNADISGTANLKDLVINTAEIIRYLDYPDMFNKIEKVIVYERCNDCLNMGINDEKFINAIKTVRKELENELI